MSKDVRKRRRSEEDGAVRQKEKLLYLTHITTTGLENVTKEEIRDLALSEGGLLTNDFRRVLWLRFHGIHPEALVTDCDITEFRDFTQVCLDVHRCNSRIMPGTTTNKVRAIKDSLKNVIIKSLAEKPDRHYYQGYHDVSLTMYYVLGERLASVVMSHLCNSHLSAHIRTNLEATSEQMRLIIPLVSQKSVDLADFIEQSDAGTMFSLSWIITWFAYVMKEEHVIYRLYDVFMTSPPLMAVYMSAAIVLHRKREIMSVECELSAVHQVLHQLPPDLPIDMLVRNAFDLLQEFPPSVIKTLPMKRLEVILKVPRFGYLDWSRNWGRMLIETLNTPAGIAITSSVVVGFAAFMVSLYAGKLQI